ncbi:MAG TPA: VWA domain-containing protein [Pyrinomonadaceae bacterium]
MIARNFFVLSVSILLAANFCLAQPETENNRKRQPKVRTVTIPISIFSKEELKQQIPQEFIEAGNIVVKEDGDQQTILSIRSISDAPLALAVLIQDDVSSSVNLELKRLGEFIRRLPKGSRVMVAYLRVGSIQVRQKFTDDLEKAAESLRIISGVAAVAPSSPYQSVEEALGRFDALPTGRRAILLISDGLDVSRGLESSSPTTSLDLERAITKAQRKSVAIYSFYASASLTERANSSVILNAQGALQKLSEETGGRAFFSGLSTPVNYEPFFREVNMSLNRQFVLTYLSTHMKKGYHKVDVTSTNPEIKIEHPKGYYYR